MKDHLYDTVPEFRDTEIVKVTNGIKIQQYTEEERRELRRQMRSRYGIGEDETVYLFSGRVSPEKGVLAGLWEFPNMEGKLSESAVREHLKASGIRVLRLSRSICARHVFTHLEWEMGAWRIDCAEPHSAFRWVTRDALRGEIALPSAWKAFSRAVFSDPPSA